jgi:hypothetical protein
MKPKSHKAPWLKKYAFRKGQSGCPGGKRRGSVSPTAALKRALTRTSADRIARSVIALAEKGDPTALRVLFDRVDFPLAGPMASVLAAKSNPAVNADGVVQFNIGVTADELEAVSGKDDLVRFYLPRKEALPGEPGANPFAGYAAEQLRNILAALEQDGASIRRQGSELVTIPPKPEIDVKGLAEVAGRLFGLPADPKGHGDGDGPVPAAAQPAVPAALAAPAPEPAAKPPVSSPAPQPAAAKPAPPDNGRPAGRSISETDLMGSPEEKAEQARIRAAGPFHRPNHRRNPFLG